MDSHKEVDHSQKEVDSHKKGDQTDENLETRKIAELRNAVEGRDPIAKELDDMTIRRFLHARNLNVEKASAMLLKYLKWRKEAVPNGFIGDSEVKNELAQNKFFTQGLDNSGRPVAILLASKHFKGEINEYKRYSVYCLDKICSRMPSGQEKFLCIADLQGLRYSNCDMRGVLAGLDIMQNYYPERLGKALLIHVPHIFMKIWKLISPFIDNKTKQKFVFVDDKDLEKTLLNEIEESQLPDIYGGKMQLISIEKSS
ncbi:hypothetical protein LUZ60_011368 [Juncus effusus]|nr:hypothetical protein LUZ60_011368 [Juncus effusus]